MKRITRILLIVVVLLSGGIIAIGAYVRLVLPDVGAAPDLTIIRTPERIEHGRYLANHVAVCMDCHSNRDWTSFSGPPSEKNFGAGGEYFGPEMGFPGKFYAKNITPYHLKDWTDGELFRAITTGVNKHGKALFPVMPYAGYGKMDPEDVYDIIAYIRSLPEVKQDVPESAPEFPVSFLINTMPQQANLSPKPFKSNKVQYGKYLVMMSACGDCHSKVDKGTIIAGSEFGGGREFAMPGGIVSSSNLTPHMETGIGHWDRATFIQRFKQYKDGSYQPVKLSPTDMNSPMPWTMYAGMETEDLEAIYYYLQSLQPINNPVTKFKKTSL